MYQASLVVLDVIWILSTFLLVFEDYEFGDVSRYTWRHLTKTLKRHFGKDYEFGDITRGLLGRAARVAESDRWKDRLLEEMESLQKEWGKPHKKKWTDLVAAHKRKRSETPPK